MNIPRNKVMTSPRRSSTVRTQKPGRLVATTAEHGSSFSIGFVQANVRIKLIPNISADNPTRTSHPYHSKKYFPTALTTARIHSVARKVVDKRELPPEGALSCNAVLLWTIM